ncbi:MULTISPECIES: LysR substrate-binding domain-containing protein [Rhodococcus]|uniref:LysR substrate-binding domain-containing protein n=1 Tax=Rhodococcus TaxID=1827 RepID=UPI001E4FED8D|nr:MULTISPECIES: LysR substrate-binding domain-containing protein [Rhodococcus erythropolis group]MCD2107867.1 LysR substrate-binding domain-containing protein [Rhodococcus qingshengii]MCZ4527038.1 LysR substrate-binding domain-containing protein [Rhodococcus erythropolis]MDV6274357.1 LysR substrate-binding domain-containing protein [Rhodococcus erythropolis]MDZ7917690.1 LysR substrate-binding domain-containing protein [Rhodococcus sp. (in: high G+C Gram-positive bacteria)]
MDMPKLLDGRLKLRHLLLVDALSRQGSVVGAAAALHITQPVATRSLHDIESILGVSLFDRGPRGITPTIFGEAFTTHARAVIAQLTEAGRHVVELADANRGTVIVGTHLAGSNVLLPGAIARLKVQHPLLTVIVREGTPEQLLTDLEAGRIDLIVGRLTSPTDDTAIRRNLYAESVELVTRVDHPLAHREDIQLEELRGFPWILPGVETVLRRELEEFFARNGLPLPENRVEATSFLTVRQLLVETDMIAVLPSLIPRDDARLTTLSITLDPIGHSVGITSSATRTSSPSAQALIATLKSFADELMRP